MKATITVILFGIILLINACSKEENEPSNDVYELSKTLNLPTVPYAYDEMDLPPGLKTDFEDIQDNMPDSNLTTPWGATLGRVLFYDKTLSINNTISCASCHQQAFGFSDPEKLSVGFDGGLTGRHSMGLTNARYYYSGKFFWDERANTLEDQVLMPIQDPVEMGMKLTELVERLKVTSHYPLLFRNAFGDEAINSNRISKALAQFVRSMVSYNSKFDKGLISAEYDAKIPFDNFSASENRGKEIFYTNRKVPCAGCHITTALISDNPRNNGVFDGDQGVYEHNPQFYLKNTFKTPSLKNIGVRAPYMHNGAFPDLESVIEHYNSGLTNPDGTLDPHLLDVNNMPNKMNLSQEDKTALMDFLLTLTDEQMLSDPVYSNPFK